MGWKRVALGIGNPGPEYAGTRHNVGFMVLERVADRRGLTFRRLERKDQSGARVFSGKVKARIAEGRSQQDASPQGSGALGEPFLLVQPLTYVNLSGDAAGPLLRAAGLGPESLFVVVDDLNLPLGRIRVRPSGSSGGHNGLASIEAALGTQDFPRLRLGIGAPQHSSDERQGGARSTVVEHVLTAFLPEEREVLGPVLERAADAVLAWLDGASLTSLMDRVNGL